MKSSGDEGERSAFPWPLAQAIAWLLCTVAVLPAGLDVDLWGHVRFGLDLLDRRALTAIDPYSFTQDVPWINHEWLSEAIMAIAYRAGGPLGLVVLKGLVLGSALMLAWRVFARGAEPLVAVTCLLVTASAALPIMVTVRPHMFSFLAVALLCRILSAPSRLALVAVPALFAVWANLHGGWIVGAAILAAWTLAVLAGDREAISRRQALLLVAASILATLVNPYGVGLWRFLWDTVGLTRSDITEWQPLWKAPFLVIAPWATAVAVVIASARTARRPPWPPSRVARVGEPSRSSPDTDASVGWPILLMAAGLAYGSLRVLRLTPFFVVSALVFLAPTMHQELAAATGRVRKAKAAPFMALTALVAAMFAAIGVLGVESVAARAAVRARCLLPAISAAAIPDQAAASALDGDPAGRLAVWFDWGEYAIWRFGPRLRVSTDGRRETVYSARTLEEQNAVGGGEPAGLAFLERTRPEYAWYPASKTALKRWLGQHRYRLDIETNLSFIAVRDDLPRLVPGHALATRCFPSRPSIMTVASRAQ